MPTKGKTAKEQNNQKWQRMNTILKELKVSSRSSAELEKLVFGAPNNIINRRSLQNYLQELATLEMINYDPVSGLYISRDNKHTFQSKSDYNLALAHSRDIFFYKVGEGTDYEGENPYFYNEKMVLLQLAFFEEDKKRRRKEADKWENENTVEKKDSEDDPSNWHPTFKRLTSFGDLGENSH